MNIKAIALGLLADLLCTVLGGLASGLVCVAFGVASEGRLGNAMVVILGSMCPVVGGAVTARVARDRRLWNAFLMGIASLTVEMASGAMFSWVGFAALFLTIPCAVLGGLIVERHCRQ